MDNEELGICSANVPLCLAASPPGDADGLWWRDAHVPGVHPHPHAPSTTSHRRHLAATDECAGPAGGAPITNGTHRTAGFLRASSGERANCAAPANGNPADSTTAPFASTDSEAAYGSGLAAPFALADGATADLSRGVSLGVSLGRADGAPTHWDSPPADGAPTHN